MRLNKIHYIECPKHVRDSLCCIVIALTNTVYDTNPDFKKKYYLITTVLANGKASGSDKKEDHSTWSEDHHVW